jgi:YD repeat-containing protein
MKDILGIALLLTLNLAAHAQFYYKDVITVQQTNAQWNVYKNNKVRMVNVQSFEGDNRPTEGFSVQQRISDNRMITTTKSVSNGTSELTATYNAAGRLATTVDTSEDFHSSTSYEYDAAGRVSIINYDSRSGEFTGNEVHIWKYDAAGKPEQMLRIRNGLDTMYVTFVYDGKDVPIEEHAIRKGNKEPEIYYYYDAKNQLTDIVRYSQKARRLLPTHIFSYNTDGRIAGMLLIPEGSNQYQRWYYDYDQRGLKTRERVFNKQQQLMGKIEYSYQ